MLKLLARHCALLLVLFWVCLSPALAEDSRIPLPRAVAKMDGWAAEIAAGEQGYQRWRSGEVFYVSERLFSQAAHELEQWRGILVERAQKRSLKEPYLLTSEMEFLELSMARWRAHNAEIQAAFEASQGFQAEWAAARLLPWPQYQAFYPLDKRHTVMAEEFSQKLQAIPFLQPGEKPQIDKLHVSDVHLDYGPWEREHAHLRVAVDDARARVERAQKAFAEKRGLLDQHDAAVTALDKKLASQRQQMETFIAKVEAGPPAAAKTASYKKLEADLAGVQQMIPAMEKRVRVAREGNADPDSLDALLNEYEALLAKETTLQAKLLEEARRLGFTRHHAENLAQAEKLEAACFALYKKRVLAATERDLALATAERGLDTVNNAEDDLSAAVVDLKRFQKGRSPAIAEIRLHGAADYFHLQIWHPVEILAILETELEALRQDVRLLGEERWEARKEFQLSAVQVSEAMSALEKGIMRSAWTQAAVEYGFMVKDVLEKGDKGLVGMLAEASRKVVESWWFGPPEFVSSGVPDPHDEDALRDMPGLKDMAWEMVPGRKRLIKTTVTGPMAKAVVQKYLAARAATTFQQAERQAMQTLFGEMGPRLGQYYELASMKQAVLDARHEYKKAVQSLFFRDQGRSLMGKLKERVLNRKLAESVVQDATKQALKKAAAEFFEGTAAVAYAEADLRVRASARILQATSYSYWHAHDLLALKSEEREQIVRQYDEKNHMKRLADFPFKTEMDVLIELAPLETDMPLAERSITVSLGGVQARRTDPGRLEFMISAEALRDVKHDGSGGVKMVVTTSR